MTNEITAIVLIDPYNDFLHQDGKLNFMVRDSLDKTNTIPNLRKLLDVAREKKFPVFYCLHQQSHDHSMQGWTMMNAALTGLKGAKVFEEGSWGAEFYEGLAPIAANGEVIVSKHWNSSSFQNTDLDYQLRQRGIRHLVMAGMVAETCLESTTRYAYEHGYGITMLSDCTAGFSHEAKEASQRLIWPRFANEVVTVDEWTASLEKGSEKAA